MSRCERLQAKLEAITSRWWFFVLVGLIQFVPPVTTVRYDMSRIQEVIYSLLGGAYVGQGWMRPLYPYFQITAIIMLIAACSGRRGLWRGFSLYAALIYLWIAFIQSVGHTQQFGDGIVINNVIMMSVVSLAWWLEFALGRSGGSKLNLRPSHLAVLIPAVIAFWYPVNRQTYTPDFNPVHFLTSPSGTAFCLITPIIVSILIIRYPKVNIVTLRITSLMGFIIGWYNMISNFGFRIEHNWWNGVLHLPLFLICLYGLILGYRRRGKASYQ